MRGKALRPRERQDLPEIVRDLDQIWYKLGKTTPHFVAQHTKINNKKRKVA
ncbi:Uncharacterised protein [Chlamydia trachomatis]|nr:Uncharacterised protein [Chlamydia trachomatis]